MKILFIAHHFWPMPGAAATVNQETASALSGRGHDVTLLGPNWAFMETLTHKYERSDAMPRGCNVQRFGPRLSGFPAFTIAYVILVLKAIPLALKAHVILCEYHFSHMASACATVVSMITRKPLVVRVHDVLLVERPLKVIGYRERLVNLIIAWFTLWSFQRAKSVLLPSPELAESCQRVYGLRRQSVDVCYNGVDTKKFSRRVRSRNLRRSLGSRRIVIFSGRVITLVRLRGLQVLLQAVPLIRKNVPDLKVLIAGPSPSPASLSRLKQFVESSRISDCVEFTELTHDVMPRYLASADIGIGDLVIGDSSGYQTTPVKTVEYMASGCIVVAGQRTVTCQLVRDDFNGFLVTPGDSEEVAVKILQIFGNAKLARTIRKRARRTIVKTFSWDVIAIKLERKLQMIAKANN